VAAADGYNELRIEDKKGEEQIYLHASGDWDENSKTTRRNRVGNERMAAVEANSLHGVYGPKSTHHPTQTERTRSKQRMTT